MAGLDDRGSNDNTLGKNHLSNPLPDAYQSFRVLDTVIARMAPYRVDEARKAAKKRLTHTWLSLFEIGILSRHLGTAQNLGL